MSDQASDPTVRTLRLLGLLQTGGAWSPGALAARLGVSARTVRRDVVRLRAMGYAVQARPGPGSEYRWGAGAVVPPLLFDAEEVTALAAGLRLVAARFPDDDAAARAAAKLQRVLPPALRARAAAVDLATEVLETAGPDIDAATIGLVADAVAAEGRIRFGYRDTHGRASARTVDPVRHVLRSGRSYLVGYDLDRADWRLFRLDRVADVRRLPGRFPRPPFPDASLERWFTTDFGCL